MWRLKHLPGDIVVIAALSMGLGARERQERSQSSPGFPPAAQGSFTILAIRSTIQGGEKG